MLGSLGFRANAFAPKPEKLNPLSGIKRIFGIQGLIELVKSLAKVALLGGIGFWVVWDRLEAIVQMGETGIRPALAELGSLFVVASLTMASRSEAQTSELQSLMRTSYTVFRLK